MSDTKHFIETYRGHDIYYDENSEKFTCDISIEDNFKSTSRVSLKACRQEIDTFIKDNLNFKPFKLFNFGYHLDFTGDINEYEAIGVRSHDGALIIEGESQYTKGEKRKESSESTNMPKSLTPLDTFDQPLSHCIKYANIQDFWKKNNLPSRKTKFAGSYWRLGDMSIGHSRGLHNLRGIAVATDGCVLIVETSSPRMNGRMSFLHRLKVKR